MDERLEKPEQTPEEPAQVAPASQPRDEQMDLLISYVLRGGVLLSAGLLILGSLLYGAAALRGGAPTSPSFPHSLGDIFSGLARRDPMAVLSLGLLVLLLTPVARVLISIFAFARERDW